VTSAILWLTLAYVTVAALVLTVSLANLYSLRVKVALICVVSSLYASAWFGWQTITGWPTSQPLPENFRVLSITIDERRKKDKTPSSIYYWVRALDSAGLPTGKPRAFRKPWSERLAEEAEQAIAEMAGGDTLNGTVSRSLLSTESESSPLSDYAGERSITCNTDKTITIEFKQAPRRLLPPKAPDS